MRAPALALLLLHPACDARAPSAAASTGAVSSSPRAAIAPPTATQTARPTTPSAQPNSPATQSSIASAAPICDELTAGNCDCARVIAFWTDAQDRLRANDIDGFLELIRFPLIVNDCNLPPPEPFAFSHRHCRSVETAAEFKRDLKRNLPDIVRKAFLAARPSNLFCNIDGAALDNGTFVAWASPPHSPRDDTTVMRIFAINWPGARLYGWR